MAYHVYTRSGVRTVGIIVGTAREALAKAAEFVEDGYPDVIIKDLFGNVPAAVIALAEREGNGS
jgi:hypothetical protein